MPTKEQVSRAARALEADGRNVSVRSVRAALPNGGSFGPVGRLLAEWKVETEYHPTKMKAQVPPVLGTATDVFVQEVWKAARVEVARLVEAETRRLRAMEEACGRSVETAWADVDRLEGEVARLRREVGRLTSAAPVREADVPPACGKGDPGTDRAFRSGGGPAVDLREPGAFVPVRTDEERAAAETFRELARTGRVRGAAPGVEERARAKVEEMSGLVVRCLESHGLVVPRPGGPLPEDLPGQEGAYVPTDVRRYWDAVMRAAGVVLAGTGPDGLTVEEIRVRLSGSVLARDPRFAAGAKLLRRKLGERADAGKYVRRLEGGRFAAIRR